jgi:hypothetical protein
LIQVNALCLGWSKLCEFKAEADHVRSSRPRARNSRFKSRRNRRTVTPVLRREPVVFLHGHAPGDQRDLAANDPLLFRELQGRCSLCRHKNECAEDLAHAFDDAQWQQWREYCPNLTVLTMIGAIQNCGYAAQHLKMPQSRQKSAEPRRCLVVAGFI